MSQRRLPPPCRYVYVIGPDIGLQKVGIATDPRSRLAALQTASPFKLMIHATFAVPFGAALIVEKRAHDLLRPAWASGEWFEISPGEAITAVKAAAATYGAVGVEVGHLPLFAFADPKIACRRKPVAPAFSALGARLWQLWKVATRAPVG